jgi:hypothetical protein
MPRQRPAIVTALLPYALALSTLLYLVLTIHALLLVGWHYVGGGSAIEKIHPATYLLSVGLSFTFLVDSRFRQQVIAQFSSDPSLVFFVLSVAATALYTASFAGASIAPFVDTFGGAIMSVIVLAALPKRPFNFLRLLVDLFFVANILLIFWEFVVHKDFFSQYLLTFIRTPEEYVVLGPQRDASNYGRMSALFGHPLTAALMFGVYSIATLVSNRLRFSLQSISRLGLSGLSYLAIFPTGSRASMVAASVIIVLYVVQSTMGSLIRGYINSAGLILSIFVGVAFVFLVTVLWSAGFFDQILERFQFDYGSASTRSDAIAFVQQASTYQLWFGMPQDDLYNMQLSLGMIAIEISWVNFILVGGLITALPLFVSFCLFLFRSLRRYCEFGIYFVALLILESTAASNSIWSKTTTLAGCLIIGMCFLRKDPVVKSLPRTARATPINPPFAAMRPLAGARG